MRQIGMEQLQEQDAAQRNQYAHHFQVMEGFQLQEHSNKLPNHCLAGGVRRGNVTVCEIDSQESTELSY